METTMILIVNWLIYGGLFGAFFIKLTDEKEMDFIRKLSYGLLMLYTLFFSVFLFNEAFVNKEKPVINFNYVETIFNFLILILMWTKVKDDKFFKKRY